jgi:hypothetical protein
MAKRASTPRQVRASVWKCDELHKVVRKAIRAHVKDATAASRLEEALQGFYAYAPSSRVTVIDLPAGTRTK